MSLYIDYRPTALDDVWGNEDTLRSLRSVLRREDLKAVPHAFLFHGPSGCGKTTLGRIVASELGCAQEDFREVDSADFRGIDSIRDIRKQMRLRPMAGAVRVWLLDECFAAGTFVSTPKGPQTIEAIRVGDCVNNLGGKGRVTHVFSKCIPLERLVRLDFANGVVSYCSDGHEFPTDRGWVRASHLQTGDLTFVFVPNTLGDNNSLGRSEDENNAALSGVRNPHAVLSGTSGEVQQEVLRPFVPSSGQDDTPRNPGGYVLPGVPSEDTSRAIVLPGVRSREEGQSASIRTDDGRQSHGAPGDGGEGAISQRNQRDPSCMEGRSGREREIDDAAATFGGPLEVAHGSGGAHEKTTPISDQLQTGRGEYPDEDWSGSGRPFSPDEAASITRFKEAGPTGITGVARVTVYQHGSNGGDFAGVVGDQERLHGYVTLYDLSVDTHPSYYANGILAHNCHKLSGDAQEALLKALEDTPPHVYFILCTTDPQKLIKTVQNRCSQFVVEPLTNSIIQELITSIADAEGKPLPAGMANQIAAKAKGSPRSALVTLDSVIDLAPEEMAGAIQRFEAEEAATIDLCRALMDKKGWKAVGPILAKLDVEPETTRRTVLGYMNSVLIKGGSQHAAWVIECFLEPFYNSGAAGLSYACYRALNP